MRLKDPKTSTKYAIDTTRKYFENMTDKEKLYLLTMAEKAKSKQRKPKKGLALGGNNKPHTRNLSMV